MFLKLYFWLTSVLIFGFTLLIFRAENFTLLNVFSVVFLGVLILGLYGFIYKKKIISQYIFAGASALNFIFLCYFLINSIKNVEFHFPISYVLWLPLIYGNFRYAFFSHNIWGENVKLKSIKMLPTTFVVLVVCYLAFLRTDEQKYREFNNLCSEKANEILYATSSSNSVYIDYDVS